MVYRFTSIGFILVFIVPLALLQQIQDNDVRRLKSNANFQSEGNNQNSTDDVYGFINDLVKRSTTDKQKKIFPIRQMIRNSTVLFQESTQSLHDFFSQNRAAQGSVANKNITTRKSSRTAKEKLTNYSATKTSQGLDAITKGAVLQAQITGLRDKRKKSSLDQLFAYNSHSELLPGVSSSVFISSILLPTRTIANPVQVATAVHATQTHDLEEQLNQASSFVGITRGISSNGHVTRIDKGTLSYSQSLFTLESEELPLSSSSIKSVSSSVRQSSLNNVEFQVLQSSSSSSAAIVSKTAARSSSQSSSSSVKSLSSVSSSILTVQSKGLSSSLSAAIISSTSIFSTTATATLLSSSPVKSLTISSSSLTVELKRVPSSSSVKISLTAATTSSSSSSMSTSSVTPGSSRNSQSTNNTATTDVTLSTTHSGTSYHVTSLPLERTLDVHPTSVTIPVLQSSSVETPPLLSSQIIQTFSSAATVTSSTTAVEASLLRSSRMTGVFPSLSSSSSVLSSSSKTTETENPMLQPQLHQRFSSSLSPSSSLSLSSSSSSLSSLLSLSKARETTPPIHPSLPHQGLLSSSSATTSSLSTTQKFSPSLSLNEELPSYPPSLEGQDILFSSSSFETPSLTFAQPNQEFSSKTRVEISKAFSGHNKVVSPFPSTTTMLWPSSFPSSLRHFVYLPSLSKQDVMSTGTFVSQNEKSTINLFSSKTLSVPTHSNSSRTNMSAMNNTLRSSVTLTLPLGGARVSPALSPISFSEHSTSVHLKLAPLESQLLSSLSSSTPCLKTDISWGVSTSSTTSLESIGRSTRNPTNSLLLLTLSTDAVKSGYSIYLYTEMDLSSSTLSSLSSVRSTSPLHYPGTISSSSLKSSLSSTLSATFTSSSSASSLSTPPLSSSSTTIKTASSFTPLPTTSSAIFTSLSTTPSFSTSSSTPASSSSQSTPIPSSSSAPSQPPSLSLSKITPISLSSTTSSPSPSLSSATSSLSTALSSPPQSTSLSTTPPSSSSQLVTTLSSPPPSTSLSATPPSSSSQLVTTTIRSYLLMPAIPSALPTPLLNSPLPIQSSWSALPSTYISNTASSYDAETATSQGNIIDNKTGQSSRKLRFLFTTVLYGKQTKASMAQKTPDLFSNKQLNSMFLSTSFNGPTLSSGSVIRGTVWTSTKPLSSQTETSTVMSTNTPFYNKLHQTSIVSSIDGVSYQHHAKSHEEMSSISTSAESQLVKFSVDYSRNLNFTKTAEIRSTLIKALPTAVFTSKGINTKFSVNPSLVIEGSRTSQTGTHGLNTKEVSSSEEATSMRVTSSARETGVTETSRISSSYSSRYLLSSIKTETLLHLRTKGTIESTPISDFSPYSVSRPKSSSLDFHKRSSTQKEVQSLSTRETVSLTRTPAVLKLSTSTSDEFPDVTKSVSNEMRSEPPVHPQDSMTTTDAEVSKTLSPRHPNKLNPSMAFYSISPTPTIYTFPASSSITDGNISTATTSDDSNAGIKNGDSPNNKILLFVIVATIPTLLLLILIAIVLFRRVKERESEPFYKIQVEYTDKQRRPRSANSRLDLTIKGMHIDLEFPSPGEKRKSARLSAPPNVSDAQMRELQKLSQECKDNLEWINEVLERELESPVLFGGSSSSENDDSMDAACINQRYSVYSACSEKEKENYEVSEKIIKRDSPKHTKYDEKDEKELKSDPENDADNNSDSVNLKDDSDEFKIKLDQRTSPKVPSKRQKPEIPPKPKIKLTAKDRIGTLVNPLSSTIFIECTAHEGERKDKIDSALSKKNTPKERTLLRKPPIPERKGIMARKPEKNTLTKQEVCLTVENKAKKESPCSCNRMSKPPIPRKPEGLVINSFRTKPRDNANVKATSTLYRSGKKIEVCCTPRKPCEAV